MKSSALVPITSNMLYEVRDQMMERMDAKFAQVDGRFAEIKSEIHRLGVLIEEQNARNLFVLDGLTVLFERQDRVEKKLAP